MLAPQLFAAPSDDHPRDRKLEYTRELEKLKRRKPSEYNDMRMLFTFNAQLLLARLGYGIGPIQGILDEKLQNALKTYESNRGIPVTGDPLSFETVEKIGSDAKLLDSAPTYLPSLHIYLDLWDSGYVRAKGTWTIVGDRMASPEQTSEIQCSKRTATCTLVTATIFDEGPGRQISVDAEQHEIERWDEHEIVTKPYQYICNRYVYRINRTQKSVSGLRSTISNEKICAGVTNADLHLALVDGAEIWKNLNETYRRNWETLIQISPVLLKKLKSSRP
jgi:hypothetical protein